MTCRPVSAGAAVLILGTAASGAGQQSPVFRATTDAIVVSVAVLDDGRPVPDLPLERFALFDDGVLQAVSMMEVGQVPVDVTLVLDTSSSMSGDATEALTRDVATIVAALDPADRVRLLTFSHDVHETRPLREAGAPLELGSMAPGGATAFYNALIAALVTQLDAGRPHLVVALSDGHDNVSWLREDAIRDVAERTDAVLQVVVREWATEPGCCPSGPIWLPYATSPFTDDLEDAARLTGGSYHRVPGDEPLTDVFGRIISDFKSTYVLWFVPSGNPAPGWHELTVRLRGGGYEVRARRGYYAPPRH